MWIGKKDVATRSMLFGHGSKYTYTAQWPTDKHTLTRVFVIVSASVFPGPVILMSDVARSRGEERRTKIFGSVFSPPPPGHVLPIKFIHPPSQVYFLLRDAKVYEGSRDKWIAMSLAMSLAMPLDMPLDMP